MPLHIQYRKPDNRLRNYVAHFWMLHNDEDASKEAVVLPDGCIDLICSAAPGEPFHASLLGLQTVPETVVIPPGMRSCAISFRLPATEYILHTTLQELLNQGSLLPPGFWGIEAADLHDFDAFCQKVTDIILPLLPVDPDNRKLQLFDLLYASDGAMSVHELSGKVYWSARQINRYFNRQYGLALKAYCSILRFRASFRHISEGKLFPEEAFADQAHFIREVRRLSGVTPRELSRNQNDRFIQFSALPPR